jgi:hypothetical protein
MKKLTLILSLWLTAVTGWAQCTITQPIITNASYSGGAFHFSLNFKHQRNNGNKWVTIHMWKNTLYPGYSYDNPPTTTRLGGVVPFGTVVINNTNVSASGTYNSSQAFVTAYQNDGTFLMVNTSASTLVYNASTDSYTLNNLQTVLPTGTSVIKFDSWSSQSSGNQNVHCFNIGGTILVPSTLGVTGLESFQGRKDGSSIIFTWTTKTETNNSHFTLRKLVEGQWSDMAVIISKYEDGNTTLSTNYRFELKGRQKQQSGGTTVALLGLSIIAAVCMRGFVPARLTILLCVMGVTLNNVACKRESPGEALLQDGQYQLAQVDRDGATTYSRIVVIYP